VEKAVEDLVVIHHPTRGEMPKVIVAEGQIAIVIGKVDHRGVIAGTHRS
jgi:hypothetical protein